MKNSIILLIFISFTSVASAQLYEVGLTFGGSNYVGDIGRTNYIYPNKFAGAAFFKYNWNPRIALKGTYSYLPINGNDADADTDFRRTRGLTFTNTIHELAVGIEYNFYEYNLSESDKSWTPYIILELAAYNYKYVTSELAPNIYEFDNKNSISIPFGLGFKSRLYGNWAFSVEAKVRYTFEDDLDFTTSRIPNLDFGGNNNDWYMSTGVSLIYTFGRPPCYANGL